MNDLKSEEYKSETVFLIKRILLHQKLLPWFSISYRLGQSSHYKVVNRQYNQFWLHILHV